MAAICIKVALMIETMRKHLLRAETSLEVTLNIKGTAMTESQSQNDRPLPNTNLLICYGSDYAGQLLGKIKNGESSEYTNEER